MSDFGPNRPTDLGFQDCWDPPREGRVPGPRGGGGLGRARAAAQSIAPTDRARLDRVARRVPEVMVKVTRPAQRDKHGNPIQVSRASEGLRVSEHLAYISRNGKLEVENDRGEVLRGKREVGTVLREWLDQHDDARANGYASERTRIVTSLMLSMPPGISPMAVQDAARAMAAQEFGGRHDYVLALHGDTKHPHVHLTVRTVGYDGTKLNLRKADLQHLRDAFAGKLRQRGIEAESTPRHARGVVRKGEATPVYKIRQRGKVPNADLRAQRAVRRDLEDNGGDLPRYAWDAALADRRDRVRATYEKAAQILGRSETPGDRGLAEAVERFSASLNETRTRRAEMAETLLPERIQRSKEKRILPRPECTTLRPRPEEQQKDRSGRGRER